MKFKDLLYFLFILIYILLSQFIFIKSEGIFQYIINPLIWLLFLLISLIINENNNHYYQNKKTILYITIISTILYNVLFYTLGYFVTYANNVYSNTINGIIINLFSITLVIFIKNYIRANLIKKYINKHIIYILVITLLLYLSSLNLPLIFNLLHDKKNITIVLIKYILPILSIEIFTSYLSYYGGALNSIIYQFILYTPSLIIPIVPNYNDIIPALFNILFPLFTYIIIKNNIRKKNLDQSLVIEKPSNLIFYFIAIILIMMFSLGTFQIKPSVILSASMEPNIKKGDIVVIKKCDINNINSGDIVEYEYDNYHVIHRVIKIIGYEEGIELVVKGDNNIKEDKLKVTKENLVGCYFLKIKYLGYPSFFIYSIFNNREVPVETGE